MVLKKSLIHLVLIALLGLVVYSNTFEVPFHWDDGINIVKNHLIKDLSNFIEPSKVKDIKRHHDPADPAVVNVFKTRIVGYLTFALNWRAHGLDVRGYHIANLAVHIMNALLVYWLVVLTFRTPFMSENPPSPPFSDNPPLSPLKLRGDRGGLFSGNSRYIALFSALLFVAHPVQTQAVTYIVQRLASLATFFYLLSLALYIRGRLEIPSARKLKGLYALSLLSAVLAMKTKEIAFTLPLVVALYEFFFFRDTLKRKMLYLVPLLLTMLIIPMSILGTDRPLGEVIGSIGEATRLQTEISRPDYLFTQFRVITTYIRLLFLPINQNLDYDYPVYGSLFNPQVFLSFLLLASIIGLGVFLLWRSRTSGPALRIAAFGIFWFFIALSVESSLIPIADVIFEHRLYLPSAGAAIAVATGAALMIERLGSKRFRIAATVVLAMVPLVLAVAAYKRNAVWHSELTLWGDVVRKSPNKLKGHNNLGNAYRKAGQLDRAIDEYLHALNPGVSSAAGGYSKLPPVSAWYLSLVHGNLAETYDIKGQTDKAIEHYRVALKFNPGNAKTHLNIGIAYRAMGLNAKTTYHFSLAKNLDPALFRFSLAKNPDPALFRGKHPPRK